MYGDYGDVIVYYKNGMETYNGQPVTPVIHRAMAWVDVLEEPQDMDGDGDLDLIKNTTLYDVSPWNSRGVIVLFNDGTGNFNSWDNIVPSASPYMFEIADFNGDGLLDFSPRGSTHRYRRASVSHIIIAALSYANGKDFNESLISAALKPPTVPCCWCWLVP